MLYAAGTLAWYCNARNVRLFAVSAGLWCTVLLCLNRQDLETFLRTAFAGFGWLVFYNLGLILLFVILFPQEAILGGRLSGPFGTNEVPRNLLVLLIGLFFKCYVVQDLRRDLLYGSTVVVFLVTVLTLSRSGLAMLCLFTFGGLHALKRLKESLVMVAAFVIVGIVLVIANYGETLQHRFLETGDAGRVEGIRIVLREGMREVLTGHGFMRSSVEVFQESANVDRVEGYSSHCFYASVFYEGGLIGAVFFAALYIAVFYRLFIGARHALCYELAFWAFTCFAFSGLFENTSWWPSTPIGLLTSVVIVMASRATTLEMVYSEDLCVRYDEACQATTARPESVTERVGEWCHDGGRLSNCVGIDHRRETC
jgi:hypothetical protein